MEFEGAAVEEMVGIPGIEPGRPEGLQILSLMRLPIPPYPHQSPWYLTRPWYWISSRLFEGGVAKW
jgi:hypothetical protein